MSARRMERAFRERGALASHDLHFGPNMTPMVDVVMVLLIFFMATTALLGPEWFINAHLPEDEREGGVEGERFLLPEVRLEVRLSPGDAGTLVDGFGLSAGTLDAFEAQVASAAPDLLAAGADAQPIVLIAPEAGVPYQDVVRAHDACSAAGLTRVGLQ